MARTTQDTFYETTIPSGTVGSDPAGVLFNQVATWLGTLQVNGVDAWTLEETGITGIVQNQAATTIWTATNGSVYRSRGDRTLGPSGAGDASICLLIDEFSTTDFRFFAAHDYGTNGANRQFATPRSGITGIRMSSLPTSTEIYVAMSINEYEICLIVNHGSTWLITLIGVAVRKQIPRGHSGIAKTTSVITGTGSNQVIPLDRDISGSIVVGEDVWIVPQTASGDAFETPTVEIETVVAITSTSITLAPSNNYAAGALIGLDPSAVMFCSNTSGGTSDASISESGDVTSVTSYQWRATTSIGENWFDPSLLGYHHGYRIEYFGQSAGSDHRGISSIFSAWTSEGQSRILGDNNRDGFDSTKLYAPFPDFGGISGYEYNLGPYETAIT